MITSVKVRKNAAGAGWFVLVTGDGDDEEVAVGGDLYPGAPIHDMSIVMAEVARWTTRMLLKHDWMGR